MNKHAKIYIAGHRGLAGSALVRTLIAQGYTNLVLRSHAELDLMNSDATLEFFKQENPEYIFLAAAKVGGILANNTYPAEFIYQNLMIEANVIHAAWKTGVTRLLFLGSSCIYPKFSPQPIKETMLLTSALEPTNRPYAVAKIAGIELCSSYNRQYGTRFLAAMLTNLYGHGDHYDLNNSHVIPALLRKFHEAKISNAMEVVVWGTGNPVREFIHSDDMANACIFLMNLGNSQFDALLGHTEVDTDYFEPPLINVGSGEGISIKNLVELIANIVGFKGDIIFDTTKPDGTPHKVMDVSRIHHLGWHARTSLEDGLRSVYTDIACSWESTSNS